MTVSLPAPHQRRPARRPSAAVNYLLVNPPLTDPTSPYHSISYLVASAREAGFTGYRCLDANIDALNYLALPALTGPLLDRAADIRARIAADIAANGWVTRDDELRYQAALAGYGLEPDFAERAIAIFRSPEAFYDYPVYRQAVMAINRWFRLLSLDGAPGLFDGPHFRAPGPVSFMSREHLADDRVIDAFSGPFVPYVEGPFRSVLRERSWEVIGFSVNFTGQLPVALRLAREARACCPQALIVFGGTEICDDVKYLRDPDNIWDLIKAADLIVPGEGEQALCQILAAIRDGEPAGIPGVLARGQSAGRIQIRYDDVAALPAPAYDVWDWDAYWTPEPVVLYSPTRGCYWNKCTFCDYGLNTDRPTSPSRERPVATVMSDLAGIATFARFVYFAVDAMSPRYIRSMTQAMAEAPDPVSWAAELRLERTFPQRGMAELLARSGCVAISFGYESGSQRILDLIDKGVRIREVPGVLRDLATHGIAAQMMGFTGFPSETAQEAVESYEFLLRHDDLWSLASIGTFVLTPGSIVARQPDRFGVELVPLPENQDIQRALPFLDRATGKLRWRADERIPPELNARVSRTADTRPWVGGIDSGHSLLYFRRYGPRLPRLADGGGGAGDLVPEAWLTVPFADLGDMTGLLELEARHRSWIDAGAPRHEMATRWLAEPGKARPGRSTVLVLPSGLAVGLPPTADSSPLERLATAVRILARARGAA